MAVAVLPKFVDTVVAVEDQAAAELFWVGTMGFEVTERGETYVSVQHPETRQTICLLQEGSVGEWWFRFDCDNLDETIHTIVEAGGSVVGSGTMAGGRAWANVLDPNGIPLTLHATE